MMTTISVIIPCYNAARFLRDTLQSASQQTLPPAEILVIDDGSTDESASIADSFGHPVRVIRQANQGESVARNRGLDEAQGDWVAFLDADDCWKPEKLEAQLRIATENVVAVHTNIYRFGSKSGCGRVEEVPVRERYSVAYMLRHRPIHVSSLMVRRSLPCRFPTWTSHLEDIVYELDVLAEGDCGLVGEPLTGYRFHQSMQTAGLVVEARRHATLVQWLQRRGQQLADTERAMLDEGFLESVVEAYEQARWQRRWGEFAEIRDYLRGFADRPPVNEALGRWTAPRWMYWLKDRFDRTGNQESSIMESRPAR